MKLFKIIVEDSEESRKKEYPRFPYRNYSHKSGVEAVSISDDNFTINVYFKNGSIYKYDKDSASSWMIDEMIKRAKKGYGLNSFLVKRKPRQFEIGRWK